MPSQHKDPSETSPLLPRDDGASPALLEAGGSLNPSIPAPPVGGINEEEPVDGDAIERHSSEQNRERQFQGMPEVQKRMKYIFPAIGIGVMLGAADQTIVVASYNKIGSDLNGLNKASWIATSYFLTLSSFQPLSGKLSDIFGRKSCLLVAYTIFGVGCLGCGLSQTMDQLIIWRAIAGLGGGSMNTIVSILFSDIVPLRDRGTWQGYTNITFSVGALIGAPLGGLFADGPGWRWSFLFQAPLCAVAIIAVSLTLKLPKNEQTQWKEKLHRVDWLGAATLVCAIFALVLGLDRGSNDSWKSTVCLVPLCLSFPLFGFLYFVEKRIASEPFAPDRLVLGRSLFAPYLCNFFSMGGYLATIFYVPLYFQIVSGHSASFSSLLLLPSIVASVLGSLFAGFYMKKTGRLYWITVICYANLTFGILLILLFSGIVAKTEVGIIIAMSFAAFNNGIGVTSSLIALISNANHEDQAIVTACSYLFRSLGSTTGISLSAAIANQVLRSTLEMRLGGNDTEKIVESVRKNAKFIWQLKPEQRRIVQNCYMSATEGAFSLQVVFAFGAAISAWFIKEKALSASPK